MTAVVGSEVAFATRFGSIRGWWRRLGGGAHVAVAFVAFVTVLALLAPLLPLLDPRDSDLGSRYLGMSWQHPLGTDSNGRDLFSRAIWGARSSLFGPVVITLVATVTGTGLALFAAWRGRVTDTIITRLFDIVFSFPGILLALLAVAVMGAGSRAAIITLSVAYTPYVGRIVRSGALREVEQPYVSALWLQGQSAVRINVFHLLSNLRNIVLAQMTLTLGYSLIDLAALSFLGVGAPQDQPDWGVMVAGGQTSIIRGHPQESLIGAVLLFMTVLAFSTLGERFGGRRGRTRVR